MSTTAANTVPPEALADIQQRLELIVAGSLVMLLSGENATLLRAVDILLQTVAAWRMKLVGPEPESPSAFEQVLFQWLHAVDVAKRADAGGTIMVPAELIAIVDDTLRRQRGERN